MASGDMSGRPRASGRGPGLIIGRLQVRRKLPVVVARALCILLRPSRCAGESALIRRLTPDDAEAFTRIRLLGLELHPEAFGTTADAWRAATPEQRSSALELGSPPTDRFVLGAFTEDRLVGLLGFKREGRASLRHKGSLWGFFVHPDHRRRGVGEELLTAALAEARNCDGLRYVRLVATTSCGDAIRVFESQGFVRYGLEAGGLRLGDACFDQAFLRCDLT